MCQHKMSIDFDRNRVQVSFEAFVGAASPEELISRKDGFKSHALSQQEIQQLSNDISQDAIDFFYNGILSFAEGIDSIFLKRFSWATVKLYYSIYYLIRASMAAKGYATLRCKSMFRLKIADGETPYGTNNKKYQTTHEGTINHYRDQFGFADRLLSNKIGDIDAYEWMMNAREIVNYRSRSFLEPRCLDIWDYFSTCVDDRTLVTELLNLENDPYVKCFQEEYAIVAIPIKRVQQTIADLASEGILEQFAQDRENFTRTVLHYDQRSMSILSDIFLPKT